MSQTVEARRRGVAGAPSDFQTIDASQLLLVCGEASRPEAAVAAALRARATGCQVAVSHPDPPPEASPLRKSLRQADVLVLTSQDQDSGPSEPLCDALADVDVVALLPGSGTLVAQRSFRERLGARPAERTLVWACTNEGPPPPSTTLAVIDEPPASDVPVATPEIGYLARLADHARCIASSGIPVAMWLLAGGFLLFTPDGRTLVVPCPASSSGQRPPSPSIVAAVVAARLDEDRDIVATLEATARDLTATPVIDQPIRESAG